MSFSTTLNRIQNKDAIIGIIGLGYVGLPLCLAFAEAGCSVIGFDVDPKKPDLVNSEQTYLKHISSDRIGKAVSAGQLSATTDFDRLDEPDAILICVPTPLTRHLEPDLSYVEATAEAIADCLRQDQIVILESTTYPGTTEEVVLPILEKSGLKCGVDFWLGFSPEREDPGNLDYSTTTIPKVVGADDDKSRELASAIYQMFSDEVVEVSSSATAEAVKLTENIFRSVNIALVNELKLIYGAMGINIWDVIDAAKTKPFGYMPFYPGPGLGGHCIPIDPFYLSWKAKEYDITTRFIELAGEINSGMPYRIVEKLALSLDKIQKKGLSGAKVLIVGVAYKKNVDDMRESPALKIIELLENRGAATSYYDPYVPDIPKTRDHAELTGRKSLAWNDNITAEFDATLIVTDHDGVDYKAMLQHAPLLVDTRNACGRLGLSSSALVLA